MKDSQLDFVFSSLADPTRRKILEQISERDLTVSEIATSHDISLPAVSKHLRVLERSGLITRKRTGREFHFLLNPKPLDEAITSMTFYKEFWNKQFDKVETYLAKSKPASAKAIARRREVKKRGR